ncbi:hypothetical protein BIFGAL_03314 [Bifidobacterium gallicum DSM 20093 = LMG 11596]|uniref:Uncharacterized protein n=1 Tax=Bifidobacterium gallicum DSM 20093 = LMG 11596 TaxID=561180 RepID=D1NTZ4_9BIFI|nr:hypothetical protein BIFGAL_03314 [Bifidobacterium gallicum DSM 20093 = LMG 11596]
MGSFRNCTTIVVWLFLAQHTSYAYVADATGSRGNHFVPMCILFFEWALRYGAEFIATREYLPHMW